MTPQLNVMPLPQGERGPVAKSVITFLQGEMTCRGVPISEKLTGRLQ
jgi:hypothetical protein